MLWAGIVMVVFLEMLRATFFARFFHDEAAETTEIYIVVLRQGTLDALHKSLDDSLDLYFFSTGTFSDFANDICLCHIFD